MTWIYKYEAKSIQKWILATNRLVELRGGSDIIDTLHAAAREITNVAPLYAAAGGAEYHFESKEDLEVFASEWPMKVQEVAPGLEVIQAWGQTTQELLERLSEARNRPVIDLPEAGPWTARAPRSGLPAVGMFERLLEDGATRAKRRRGEQRRALGPESTLGSIWTEDLHNKHVWGEGPVAVIHADGNGIGQTVINLRQDDLHGEKIARFASSLDEATKAAAMKAVAFLKDQVGKEEDLPARPIVLGGDDFTFIVRGEYAIDFLKVWLEAFEQETFKRPEIPGRLTACGGIVFVNSRFPFATAHEVAELCCKQAKSVLRASGRSGFVFERVTTSQSDELSRSLVYHLGEGDTGGVNWKMALEALKCVENLPRGKFRQWIALQGEEKEQLWRRIDEVARTSAYLESWEKLTSLVEKLGSTNQIDSTHFVSDMLALKQLGYEEVVQ